MAFHTSLNDTICAPATPAGIGALGVIRLSGVHAIAIADKVFHAASPLRDAASHTLHYGHIKEGDAVVDEVMAAVFRAPRSFTTEDTVEFSCHGSPFILGEVLRVLSAAGARPAGPGEFTLRAFLHGRLDLAQAEAVADLIAADSNASHDIAINQLRGGISYRIAELRTQLVDFAALVELELDFVEEDVEFADRQKLEGLVGEIRGVLDSLIRSFRLGNALRNGVATVIAGRPNAGKSTLLNSWLQDDRAIVSDIPGTTRDTIEEVLHLEGIAFRLIDTAGIREASDAIERLGVERTLEKIRQSALLVYLFDVMTTAPEELRADLERLRRDDLPVFLVGNKVDLDADGSRRELFESAIAGAAGVVGSSGFSGAAGGAGAARAFSIHWLSAASGQGLEDLGKALVQAVVEEQVPAGEPVVANHRHHDALRRADAALADVQAGLGDGRSGELVALDIRNALEALGEITGEVTNDEVLGSIFGRFCIGK